MVLGTFGYLTGSGSKVTAALGSFPSEGRVGFGFGDGFGFKWGLRVDLGFKWGLGVELGFLGMFS